MRRHEKRDGAATPGALLRRLVKFNAVGAAGMVVQALVLAYLVRVVGLNYLLATALAVEAAVLHNYLWHRKWTWADRLKDRGGDFRREAVLMLFRFNLSTGIVSIVSNLVLMRALVGEGGLNVIAANIATIALSSVVNFLVSDRCVFT